MSLNTTFVKQILSPLVNQAYLYLKLHLLCSEITVSSEKHKKEAEWSEGIEKRLDAIIRILLKQTEVQESSTRNHIQLLSEMGLADVEIARILGRSRGYVSSELTVIRSGGKSSGK